jgi:hypothetical protein
MSASQPLPPGPAGSTRQAARKQAEPQGKSRVKEDSDSESNMALEVYQLKQEIARLSRELSLATNRSTSESPPTKPQQSAATRFQSEASAVELRIKLSEQTPTIDCLTDGSQLTFRQ